MKHVLLLAVILSFSLAGAAQVYVPTETIVAIPYGAPVVTTPMAALPSPGTADLAVATGQAPVLMTPTASYGWVSSYAVGASNATFPNQAGASNTTIGSLLYAPPSADYGLTLRAPGGFNTGAAMYSSVSYTDLRSLGEVAAQLKKQPKSAVRVYTNQDISRLKQPQAGTTLGPQNTTPNPQNPNLPQH